MKNIYSLIPIAVTFLVVFILVAQFSKFEPVALDIRTHWDCYPSRDNCLKRESIISDVKLEKIDNVRLSPIIHGKMPLSSTWYFKVKSLFSSNVREIKIDWNGNYLIDYQNAAKMKVIKFNKDDFSENDSRANKVTLNQIIYFTDKKSLKLNKGETLEFDVVRLLTKSMIGNDQLTSSIKSEYQDDLIESTDKGFDRLSRDYVEDQRCIKDVYHCTSLKEVVRSIE